MSSREINLFNLPLSDRIKAMGYDVNGDGKLSEDAVDKHGKRVNEIALFGEEILKDETGFRMPQLSVSIWENAQVSPQNITGQKELDDIQYAIEVAKAATQEAFRKKQISNLVVDQAIEKKINPKEIDVEYWTNITYSTSESYNIPPEILVPITGKEGSFDKHVSNGYGRGPMGVTPATTAQIMTQDRCWRPIVEALDEDLYKDIMYKKDKDGNFIKDSNGNFVRKYSTVKELNKACAEDDELSMKLGTFAFKLNYAKAVAEKLYGSDDYKKIGKVIEGMKNKEIKFTADENKELVTNALKRYNTVFKRYATKVINSMINRGINFADLNLIR